MSLSKCYTRINWMNKEESLSTPLNAINLNKLDYAVNEIDDRVISIDASKAEQSTVLTTISDWTMDENTGIITVTKVNGEQIIFDLNVEKIPVSFELSEEGVLTMITDDGTVYTANIGDMIPVLTFKSSDTINVIATEDENGKLYTFEVKDGSITESKLQPNYLAEIRVESANAVKASARASEDALIAEESASEAKQYRDEAEQFRNEAFTSTPAGYQELIDKVDSLKEKEGVDITTSAIGASIYLTDSTDNKATAFALYGKATQDGIPTPDAPVEIEVAGASGSVEVSTLSEDGTKSTTATIPTPNGLPGIPVSSDGNYTDENGQQWISDSIVKYADGTGKRVQRVAPFILDGSEKWSLASTIGANGFYSSEVLKQGILNASPIICNSFVGTVKGASLMEDNQIKHGVNYDGTMAYLYLKTSKAETVEELKDFLSKNPANGHYILAEPIITDLSAEEIAEIEKLQTFYPVTNISNDAGCGMEVEYITEKNITTQTAIEFANISEADVLKSGDTVPAAFAKIKKFMEQGGSGGTGTTDYNDLDNMPKIGGVTLEGDVSLSDLGIIVPTYEETLALLNAEEQEVEE